MSSSSPKPVYIPHISVFWVTTGDKTADSMSTCPYTYILLFFSSWHISAAPALMSTDSIWTSVFGRSPIYTEGGNYFPALASAGNNFIIRAQSSLGSNRCGRQRNVVLTRGSRWITGKILFVGCMAAYIIMRMAVVHVIQYNHFWLVVERFNLSSWLGSTLKVHWNQELRWEIFSCP